MMLTRFYRFWLDFGLPFGGYFGEQMVKKSVIFVDAVFLQLLEPLLGDLGLFF